MGERPGTAAGQRRGHPLQRRSPRCGFERPGNASGGAGAQPRTRQATACPDATAPPLESPAGSAAFRVVAREPASRKSRLPSRGCFCCGRDCDSARPGRPARAPARLPAHGLRRRWLRFLPARTMKWMFKEDHALGKGGPGLGAARRRPRRPPSSVSPSAAGPPDSVCPCRFPEPVVLSLGGQPSAALAEAWRGARGRPP